VIDLAASSIVGLAGVTTGVAWAAAGAGRAPRIERVEQAGSSPLLGKGVQVTAYRALQPLGRALIRMGVTANAITLSSVPLAAAAGVALAAGHYGVGAALGGASYACDALDGLVARAAGTASAAGEILDAVCDRVCEALMLCGLAVAWRSSVWLIVLVLAAEVGAQQVTLATAKADAFPVARDRVPRGLMRRAERAVYFIGAAALGGALADLLPPNLAPAAARAPLVVAMALVAVLGNLSALSRFAALARALRSIEVQHGDP
jgi:CDP-diacylglycerol--glycerol-3-phosphate 3-phosphatidyltransferase